MISILFILLVTQNTFSQTQEDSTLKRIVLDNGLTVILKEKHDVPMIAMQMWVKAGSITEGNNMGSGLSHYFEHMLGKRTHKRGTEQFYNDIRRMGGSDANAYTTYDRTVYHFTIRSEYLDSALEGFSDMIQNTVFDEKESQKEIQVILKEINMNDDSPDRYLWHQFMSLCFTTHPYRYPVIGYRNLFKSLTKKDILEYYKTMYSPNNMILVLAGNLDIRKSEILVKKWFGNFQRKKVPPIYIPSEPQQVSPRKIVKQFGISTTKVTVGYKTVNALSKDTAALDVLAMILGHGRTSRLYRKLKEEKQLVNSVSTFSWTPKHVGVFATEINLNHKYLNYVLQIIENEINSIKKYGVTRKELKRAKQKVRVDAVNGLQTVGGYARSLAHGEFLGDINFDRHYLESVNRVNNWDIIRVARKYLNKNGQNMVILLPNNYKNSSIQKKVFQNKKNQIEKIVLPNGLTLLIKQDHSIPLVSMHAMFNGGYHYENYINQGIFNLLSKTILKGTFRKSYRQIAEIIEDTGGNIVAKSDRDFFSIQGTFLKENFLTGFKLLTEIMSNANFPVKEIQKEKKIIYAKIKQRDDNIWDASRYHLRRIRFQGHPYSFDGIGTVKSIQKITQHQLISMYRNMITPKNTVLSIFGDINKQQILNLLRKPSKFNYRKTNLPITKRAPQLNHMISNTLYKDEKRRQSIIKIVFDAPNYYNKDRYPLMLLTHVFSGIGSRLFNDLRGKRTLAYSTGGVYDGLLDIGLFLFYIGTEPSKKQEAIRGLIENIQKVKDDLITPTELEIAKNSTIGRIIKSLQSLNGQAALSAYYEKLGLGYNYYLELIRNLKMVTREDIKRVANKYFNLNKYTLSIVESKPQNP